MSEEKIETIQLPKEVVENVLRYDMGHVVKESGLGEQFYQDICELHTAYFKALEEGGSKQAELEAKAEAYDKAMSIPLRDGSRLKVGECFTEENSYPFFSDGHENYNAKLYWDDEEKSIFYDLYPVSNRVMGRACGGTVGELNLELIVRRNPVTDCKEAGNE